MRPPTSRRPVAGNGWDQGSGDAAPRPPVASTTPGGQDDHGETNLVMDVYSPNAIDFCLAKRVQYRNGHPVVRSLSGFDSKTEQNLDIDPPEHVDILV
jgi:hypothetical protein